MRHYFTLFLILIGSQFSTLLAQKAEVDRIHILFYNTENLFDTSDDPATEDEEFLPEGDRHWTNFRFHTKLNHISKVLLATAGFEPPEIIGLCEVENRGVLEQLAKNTALKNYSYRIIHKDSPDERGIDVGLLYRSDRIQALTYHYIPLLNANHEVEKTREILHAEFLLAGDDTLHVFFNHWPSRYRGQAETEADRMLAATTLREAVLKVLSHTPGARIVIMGDFNDQPKDESLKSGLLATKKDDHAVQDELINLSYNWKQGTIKYRQTWSIFDQIIVSDGLLRNREWNTSAENAKVVDLPFLLEHDEKYQGKKLNRTYVGFNYHGGFSDHLPILLELDR